MSSYRGNPPIRQTEYIHRSWRNHTYAILDIDDLTIQNLQSYSRQSYSHKGCGMTSPDARNLQYKLLRLLPSVDEIVYRLKNDGGVGSSDTALTDAVRKAIGINRQLLLEQINQKLFDAKENASLCEQTLQDIVLDEAKKILSSNKQLRLEKVINATGIVLHTNLGRAPLSDAARAAIDDVAQGYSNLEFDLNLGLRGKRGTDVESLLWPTYRGGVGIDRKQQCCSRDVRNSYDGQFR